jgi:hypothetical protein
MYRGAKTLLGFLLALTLLTAPSARAAWCGENGTVRLSFTPGPQLKPVATIEPGDNGLTTVDLYAWLTDVERLQRDGVEFEGLSAFELHLVIEGAEGFIIKQEYSQEVRQVGKKPGNCIVGLYPGLYFTEGAVQLVHWQIMFQGQPENVVFRLDAGALITCDRTPGSQPAYLNPSGDPDLTESHGTVTWRDVGRFHPVEDKN